MIPWDLEGTPLQIKTDSILGSGEKIRVDVYENDKIVIGGVQIKFTSPMQYRIGALIITCNGVEVLNYLFADSSDSNCVPRWGGSDVKYILFHKSDTASDFYRAGKGLARIYWTAVERNVTIPWELEATPLQIKTDSTLGSNDLIYVMMYDEDVVFIGNVGVKFSSPMQYLIVFCTIWTDLPVEPPVEVNKVWTITKTETGLIITCNNVEVLNYLFADSSFITCVPNLGGYVVEKIMFYSSDKASDFYRAVPECPAFTVDGSTQGSWTTSPTGTTATIECADTHSLVGTATLTCQEDGSWSSDIPQCAKNCPAFTVDGSTQGSWKAKEAGTTVTITCQYKHVLIGAEDGVITCQENGEWSQSVKCRRLSKLSTGRRGQGYGMYVGCTHLKRPTTRIVG
eukprot:sb/3465406/